MKNVKHLLSITLLLFFVTQLSAQEATEWKEMEDFHTVMSQTWHPVEEGNYAPIRERAGELATVAEAWKKSDIPAEFKAVKDIKKLLKELASESKELEKEIAKGCSDEEIKEELQELHDVFHNIVGLCKE